MYFSIVIPLYNKSKYIRRCIGSLLKQSFRDFEIVVIDDCSNDESVEKVRTLSDGRIRICTNETNRGPSYTRNAGIRASRGQYIVFLDADDYVMPGYLATLQHAILSHPNIHVFGVGIQFGTKKPANRLGSWTILPHYSYHEYACKGQLLLTSSSSCCERSVFDRAGLFDESARTIEDPELWVRVSSNYEIAHYSGKMVVYDIEAENSLSKSGRRQTAIPVILDTLITQYQQSENRNVYMLYARFLMTSLWINTMAGSPKAVVDALDQYASRLNGVDAWRYRFLKLFNRHSLMAMYWLFRFIKYRSL